MPRDCPYRFCKLKCENVDMHRAIYAAMRDDIIGDTVSIREVFNRKQSSKIDYGKYYQLFPDRDPTLLDTKINTENRSANTQ